MTYLLRQHMSTEISQGKLESSIGAIYDDFDGDQGIRANWHSMGCLGRHGRQTSLVWAGRGC